MNTILVKTKFLLPSLPRAEKKVAEYLIYNPDAIRGMTLQILSQETGSSDASVIRFCRRLGFDGFSSFKQEYLSTSIDENDVVTEEIVQGDSMVDILRKVSLHNTKTLEGTIALYSKDYDEALEVLLKAKSVHFFGVGDAFIVAQWACLKFSRMGFSSTAYSDLDKQLITASSMTQDDVAFAITYSGATYNVVNAMKAAKDVGAKTICITQMNKSPILKYIDIKLFISISDLTVGQDIVSRRIADQAIIEALYLGVLTKSGEERKYAVKRAQKAMNINKI